MRKESFEAAFDIIKDYFFNDNLKAYTTFEEYFNGKNYQSKQIEKDLSKYKFMNLPK